MYTSELGKEKHLEYINNKPFPHIVIHNLFDNDRLKEIVSEFPSMEKNMEDKVGKTTVRKLSFREPNKIDLMTTKTQKFCRELNDKPFLSFLEELTGIKDLIADDTYEGGGPHIIGRGGFLSMHVDFNLHPRIFFFNDTATTEIYTVSYTLSLHDALPISSKRRHRRYLYVNGVQKCAILRLTDEC